MPRAGPVPPLRDYVARRFAVPSPFWSWVLFERIGGALAYGFARAGAPPALVTLFGGIAGIWGAARLATADDPRDSWAAAGLLLLAYSLDCADGQLARSLNKASPRGAWVDVVVDAVVIAFLATGVCVALSGNAAPSLLAFVLAGSFGAIRTASLFTSAQVRSSRSGGIKLTARVDILRKTLVALIDTPFVYAAVCATRLIPSMLSAVVAVVVLLTAMQTLGSAQHHFTTTSPSARS